MKVRTILVLTALLSAIAGAVVVYLMFSVPNDLKADSMLKAARKDLESGKREEARSELSKIVSQFPRTDAAAAATIALVTLETQERKELDAEIKRLHDENAQHAQTIAALQQSVDGIKNAPPPPPAAKTVEVQAPRKKAAAHKKTTTHRRRRRR